MKFQNFVEKQVPKQKKKGTNSPLSYSRLLYLNLLDTSMFIETHE